MNQRLMRIGFVAVLTLTLPAASLTQERTERTERPPASGSQSEPLVNHPAAVPLDAPIDASAYLVGPGDQFSLSISSLPPQLLTLTVSAAGTLAIPLVGEVPASGKTLAAFQAEVVRAVSNRYVHSSPTVSLVSPRRIVVRVRGAGLKDGTQIVYASDRVQSLLAQGDTRRTIRIFRTGSDPIVVDLERYASTRDSKWSPYLREGDEVVFSGVTTSRASVTVGGAVVLPGTIEWRPGDRLRDMVQFAKGLTEGAVRDSIQVLRASGPVEWHRPNADVEVNPGDRILVLSQELPSREALVMIDGEVQHPGWYPIVASRTRLSEIIAMAGGVTDKALVHATSVYRRAPSGDEERLLLLTAERGNAALEDTSYLRIETQARLYGEPVNVDAVRAISEPASDENISLEAWDRVFVPRRTGMVYVFGQVRRPGHQPFRAGAPLSEYVERAGGYTIRAKDDEASVIKLSTRQWLSPDATTIEEGDMIWVPRVVERDLVYQLTVIGQIAGIVSAAATLILLVSQTSK